MNASHLSKQRGAISIMTALLLPMLLGVLALAIDAGYVLLNRNRMQVAADSAALVSAGARQHGQDISTAQSLAMIATQANGFTNGIGQTLISVAIPPGGDEVFSNDSQYVRVTVSQPIHSFLAWIFGVTQTQTSASAIAGPAGFSQPCLLALASQSAGALTIKGNGLVTANSCGIYVNSSNALALQVIGNATVKASTIQVVGGYSPNKNTEVSPVTTGAEATSDPFSTLKMPPVGACTYTDFSQSGNGSLELSPGTYCGGIQINGKYAVHFNPGVYVIYGGGIHLSSNVPSVTGAGVSFYNTGNGSDYPYSSIKLAGNVQLNLSAPSTGDWSGMLVMQDPLNLMPADIVGSAGTVLGGNLYFPKNDLVLTGNDATNIPIGSVVAQSISIKGNAQFSMTNAFAGGTTSTARTGLYR